MEYGSRKRQARSTLVEKISALNLVPYLLAWCAFSLVNSFPKFYDPLIEKIIKRINGYAWGAKF